MSRRARRSHLLLAQLALWDTGAHATDRTPSNPAEALELPVVNVIGTSPLPGLGSPLEDVPAKLQVYTGDGIRHQHQGNLAEFLTQNGDSVSANAAQGNPFQPDIAFRGITASPLLGTPQGLSVFQDGVRVNEPFGDIVNWDLIPPSAISSVQLIPGSNPAFGLNTLGGALSVYTKSGAQYPGGALELSGGSFGRRTVELEWGGARFNPAVGVNVNPGARLTLYASYSEGMRAPTAIELTCADPAAPCKLPYNFISDPTLRAVVARTAETGLRGNWRGWQLSAAAYSTRLSDDIGFISSSAGASNAGYFANVGATRRTGFELGATRSFGALAVSARYSLIDATFRSAFLERSPDNSSADVGGTIRVVPGDQLPGIPRQSLKLRLDCRLSARWSAGASLAASSGVYARGDENNADRNGRLPGSTLANLDTRYRLSDAWQVFARVNNLFDRRYYDFGILGENFFTGAGESFGPTAGVAPRAEQFRGPSVPRGFWLGVRYLFGGNIAASGDAG